MSPFVNFSPDLPVAKEILQSRFASYREDSSVAKGLGLPEIEMLRIELIEKNIITKLSYKASIGEDI